MLKKVSLIFTLTTFTIVLYCQHQIKYYGSPLVSNYTKKDFKTESSQTWYINQDNVGIMYFGSNEDLLTYDGIEWRKYPIHTNTPIRSIDIDTNSGIIYIGAFLDFGYFKPNEIGDLKYYSLNHHVPDSIKNYQNIWKTHVTKQGVYFASHQRIFKWHNDSLEVIEEETLGMNIFEIKGQLFLFSRTKGFSKLVDKEVVPLLDSVNFFKKQGFLNACYFDKNEILITSNEMGLFIYNIENRNISSIPLSSFVKQLMKQKRAYQVSMLDDKRIAIVTRDAGIVLLNENGSLSQIINTERGLKTNSLYYVFYDKDKNLWTASDNGISRIDISCPIQKFGKNQHLNYGVNGSVIHDSMLYVGTKNGMYYLDDYTPKLDADNHCFVPIEGFNTDFGEFTKIEDRLIACGFFGIAQFNKKQAERIYRGNMLAINYSEKFPNKLIFGLRTGFVNIDIKIDENKHRLQTSPPNFFKGITEAVNGITYDDENNIWLSTQGSGPIFVRLHNNDFSDYTITKFRTNNGLPKKIGMAKVKNINGTINVVTKKGIYKAIIEPNQPDSLITFVHDKKWGKKYTVDSSLVDNIYFLSENKFLLDGEDLTLVEFTEDSVKYTSNIFNRIKDVFHIGLLQNNELGIGTAESYLVYNLDNEKDYNKSFNTLVRKVLIGRDSLIFNGYYTDEKAWVQNHQTEAFIPELRFKDNTISFEYAAIFYEESDKTEYSCLLEGYDIAWSKWSLENKRTYTNLKEGEYTFRVKAKNIYDIIGNETIYKFTIYPPWYRTIYAFIAYIVFGLLFILAIVRIYTYRLKQENIKLERIVAERTEEILAQKNQIENQSIALQSAYGKLEKLNQFIEKTIYMLVHDLKNPLSLILKKTKDKEVKQSSYNMQKIVLNMLEISKSKQAKLKVTKEPNSAEFLIEEALKRVQYIIEQKNLHIEKRIDPEIAIHVDSYLTIRIIENLLTNSIKYSKEENRIIISVYQESSRGVIRIQDFGQGISKENLDKIFEEYSQFAVESSGILPSTGLGTTFCKLATEAQGGTINIESEIDTGTTVTLTFAIKSNDFIKQSKNHKNIFEINLSTESKNIISAVITHLKETPIFEASKIFEILKPIENKNEETKVWSKKVKSAVLSSDEVLYQKLIENAT